METTWQPLPAQHPLTPADLRAAEIGGPLAVTLLGGALFGRTGILLGGLVGLAIYLELRGLDALASGG